MYVCARVFYPFYNISNHAQYFFSAVLKYKIRCPFDFHPCVWFICIGLFVYYVFSFILADSVTQHVKAYSSVCLFNNACARGCKPCNNRVTKEKLTLERKKREIRLSALHELAKATQDQNKNS